MYKLPLLNISQYLPWDQWLPILFLQTLIWKQTYTSFQCVYKLKNVPHNIKSSQNLHTAESALSGDINATAQPARPDIPSNERSKRTVDCYGRHFPLYTRSLESCKSCKLLHTRCPLYWVSLPVWKIYR